MSSPSLPARDLCPISPHALSVPRPKDLLDPSSSLTSSGSMPSLPGYQFQPLLRPPHRPQVPSPLFSVQQPGTLLNCTTHPASPGLKIFPVNSVSVSSPPTLSACAFTFSSSSLESVIRPLPDGSPGLSWLPRDSHPSSTLLGSIATTPTGSAPLATPLGSKGCLSRTEGSKLISWGS